MLMLALLNPLLIIVYLLDIVQKLDRRQFARVLFRAATIASSVFCCFAVVGENIFSDVIQVEFASFQIFGGIIFLLIGIQFVFQGPTAIALLRGESEYLTGAIAMPVLIGPGTISASILIGQRLDAILACVVVLIAVSVSVLILSGLKLIYDWVHPLKESLINRYIEIAGRVTALYVGTVAIEMMMQGFRTWADKF